jgi:hypothetical protein
MMLFDEIYAVDWSGAKQVFTPSIAVAKFDQKSKTLSLQTPSSHSLWSRELVYDFITEKAQSPQKIFIGIDCNFSYSQEVLIPQFGAKATAFHLWSDIDKICASEKNFYAQAYWTDPQTQNLFWVSGQKPKDLKLHQRCTERECARQNLGHPESPFKLIGAKQVGKGGLSGMRLFHALRKNLKDKIAFWPFEEADKLERASVVMAEIYPRLFIQKAKESLDLKNNSKVTDARTLNHILQFFSVRKIKLPVAFTDHMSDSLIAAAGLQDLFRERDFKSLRPNVSKKIQSQEGWIIGV